MDYGMTPQGFIPKRLAEIQAEMNNDMASIVDPATGEYPFINASDDSILQQIVGVFSKQLSECWNAAYDGSIQFDPLKNTGAGQAGTVQLNAMLKKPGGRTIVKMVLGDVPGTLIPQGSRITTIDNQHTFITQTNVLIQGDGEVVVNAIAQDQGDFIPEENTVISIQTPVNGWNSASNIELVAPGSYPEDEEELRRRQQQSTSLTSYRLIESIQAAVLNVPGVIYSRTYQNARVFPEDDRGIPYKEVALVAEGGDPHEIAKALFLRLPTGQVGFGSELETLYDTQGIAYNISFTRPTSVDVWVDLTIRLTNRADFPDNYQDLIKQEIVSFAEYGGEGKIEGFPPGANIIRSRLYTPINRIKGHSIDTLLIGVSETVLYAQDVEISWSEVGRFDEARINITLIG